MSVEDLVGRTVRIFNLRHQEYLYAADYAPRDKDRRRVFTWRSLSNSVWYVVV